MVARLNAIDRLVAWVNPGATVERLRARNILAYYEAAQPSRLRKSRRERGSGNAAVLRAGASLREIARHLEQNHDLARGVLATLVINTVGPNGIGIEPQPRRADGSIDDKLASEIAALWKDWCRRPEVTGQHDYAGMSRLLARSWYRDGEVFGQTISGLMPSLNHGTRVPFSVEMLEADFVPMDKFAASPVVNQGIELNGWGAPVAYHVYRSSPLDGLTLSQAGSTKRVSADNMLHVKLVDRIRQLRGVSVFASVLTRFEDLKDYEESERIAAKIAASMAAYIKKGDPQSYGPAAPGVDGESQGGGGARALKMQPGMIFDDLLPGEDIGTIDTNRPNPNLQAYRDGQLRAIAAGTGPSFSSISRTYNGTYSAQRQELVEGFGAYGVLSSEFIGRWVQPMYERFIQAAIASRQLIVPAGVVLETVDDAAFMPPAMPWIDPKKEIEAWALAEDRAYVSGPEIIRKRGGNPSDTLQQQARWLQSKRDAQVPPAGQALAVPVDPREGEDQRALAALRHREAEAEARQAEARTQREEELTEVILALRRAEVQALEADVALRQSQKDAARAQASASEAERALTAARAERERVDARLADERAQAVSAAQAEEHERQLALMEQQTADLRKAERDREAEREQTRAHAHQIQAVELEAARANLAVAQANEQAARLALDELRGGA